MGGLIRVPKPAAVVAVASPVAPVIATAPAPTPEAAATAARTETRDRARRGLAGTVATSARGALDMATLPVAGRKNLLGE